MYSKWYVMMADLLSIKKVLKTSLSEDTFFPPVLLLISFWSLEVAEQGSR